MKKNKLSWFTRLVLVVCGLSLIAVLYVPLWRIDLDAPQYPEGLKLSINANGLGGNVDIINGLNHYIGMKTLHKEDFPEFTILPYCIGFFVVVFLLVAFLNRRKWFYTALTLFVTFGIIAMVDFWRWEYNYGHNLDPHAAIVVPGMAYQPPLIGYKQLLNFAAYSIPDTGGWIFVGCGALLLMCFIIEWRKKVKMNKQTLAGIAAIVPLLFLSSCKTGPEAIKIGVDNCTFCKMTISDARFGAELVTGTGRVYKFDDIRCLTQYMATIEPGTKKKAKLYFTDFCGTHSLIAEGKSILFHSEELKCPMDGHLAAFSSLDSLNAVNEIYHGEKTKLALQ